MKEQEEEWRIKEWRRNEKSENWWAGGGSENHCSCCFVLLCCTTSTGIILVTDRRTSSDHRQQLLPLPLSTVTVWVGCGYEHQNEDERGINLKAWSSSRDLRRRGALNSLRYQVPLPEILTKHYGMKLENWGFESLTLFCSSNIPLKDSLKQ